MVGQMVFHALESGIEVLYCCHHHEHAHAIPPYRTRLISWMDVIFEIFIRASMWLEMTISFLGDQWPSRSCRLSELIQRRHVRRCQQEDISDNWTYRLRLDLCFYEQLIQIPKNFLNSSLGSLACCELQTCSNAFPFESLTDYHSRLWNKCHLLNLLTLFKTFIRIYGCLQIDNARLDYTGEVATIAHIFFDFRFVYPIRQFRYPWPLAPTT